MSDHAEESPDGLRLSYCPFFDSNVLPVDLFLRNAAVTLSSPDGSEILRPDSAWNPVLCFYEYFYSGQMTVQAAKTYTLSIVYNGETSRQRLKQTAAWCNWIRWLNVHWAKQHGYRK